MKKVLLLRIVRFFVPLILLFFLCFELQRSFTDFPKVRFYLLPGSVSEKLSQGTDIYSLLGNWSTFAYYTTISNILFVITIFLKWTCCFKISRYWVVSIMINMILTCVVFWTSIAPFIPWGQSKYYDFINVYEHTITVIASFILLFLTKKTTETSIKKAVLYALIVPILYLIFAVVIYLKTNNGIYPFLNFSDFFALGLSKAFSIVLCCFTIAGILMVIILLTIILTRYSFPKMNKKLHKSI